MLQSLEEMNLVMFLSYRWHSLNTRLPPVSEIRQHWNDIKYTHSPMKRSYYLSAIVPYFVCMYVICVQRTHCTQCFNSIECWLKSGRTLFMSLPIPDVSPVTLAGEILRVFSVLNDVFGAY